MQLYHNYNTTFTLPNRRTVYVPTEATRDFGSSLIRWITRRWRTPYHFYHLRRGGHVAAARSHLRDRLFLRCDLFRCFDYVTRSKIHRALKSLGFSHKDALEFACRSVVAKANVGGKLALPFGFPQSPILASLVLDRSALGAAFRSILQSGVRLSMYMDDMLLSAGRPDILEQALGTIVEAAGKSGFEINTCKTAGPIETIEVFNLRLTNGDLYVTEERMKLFEAAVLSPNLLVVAGVIGYVATVNRDQALRLQLIADREILIDPELLR